MTMATMNTTRVLRALKRRDAATVQEVFETWREPVIRYVQRIVNDRHLAEDLAQETFLKVYKNLDRVDLKGNLGNWIFTIARNLTLDYLRQCRRDRTVFVDELEAGYCADPADDAGDEEEAEILNSALSKLTTRQRYALVKKEAEDETFREIGEHLGCTISHVRTLIHHAKAILQESMPVLHRTLPRAS